MLRMLRMPRATTQPPCGFFVHWPTKAMPPPSTISGSCTPTGRAYHRTTLRPRYFLALAYLSMMLVHPPDPTFPPLLLVNPMRLDSHWTRPTAAGQQHILQTGPPRRLVCPQRHA